MSAFEAYKNQSSIKKNKERKKEKSKGGLSAVACKEGGAKIKSPPEAEAQSLMESAVALNKENLRRKKRKSDQANGKTSNGKKSKTLRETAHQVQSLTQLPSIF